MPYRFRTEESLDEAVRRVARDEVASAIEQLGATEGDRHEHVHEARKSTKKIRALIRLVRPVLGELARGENAWYRNTARMLSGLRDAQAVIESVDKLRRAFPRRRPRQFSRLRKGLVARRDALAHTSGDLEIAAGEALERLTIAGARIESWPPFPDSFDAIGGLVTFYRRGRRLRRDARDAPTAIAIHEWRKRVKDHWYHIRLLEECWPAVMTGLIDSLANLSETLGDHHDLEMLRAALADEARFSPADVATIEPLIASRQDELAHAAQDVASRVYGERPTQFARRFARYWDAWRKHRVAG